MSQPPHAASSVPDLSYVSEPIAALYPLFTPTRETLSPFLLTAEQLAFYTANGYISNLPCLTSEQCDALLADYEQIVDWSQGAPSPPQLKVELLHMFHCLRPTPPRADPHDVHCWSLGHWRASPKFHDLLFHPAIAVRAAQCMAACFTPIPGSSMQPVVPHASVSAVVPVSFWHDELFATPSKYTDGTPWAQDDWWTRTGSCNHASVHIALDETSDKTAIHFIPGSHRWSQSRFNANTGQHELQPLDNDDRDLRGMTSLYRHLTPERQQQFLPVAAPLKRGEMCIHHPLTVHGDYGNDSDTPLRDAIVNVMATGTQSRWNGVLPYGDTDVVVDRQELRGRFFPQLFDPQWLS